MAESIRTLKITEQEENALVSMISFFNDMGLPEDCIVQEDFDSLSDKVCDPGFWEYS